WAFVSVGGVPLVLPSSLRRRERNRPPRPMRMTAMTTTAGSTRSDVELVGVVPPVPPATGAGVAVGPGVGVLTGAPGLGVLRLPVVGPAPIVILGGKTWTNGLLAFGDGSYASARPVWT